jgi:hypothetical protein
MTHGAADRSLVRKACLVAGAFLLLMPSCASPASGDRAGTTRQALTGSYEPDCNDPDAHDTNCTEPTREIVWDAQQNGYPYYIGHAEPTAEFFSRAGASGNNMQWKFQLPSSDPSPAQNGSSVANFELYSTTWMGLALCDPNSNPFGACTPNSDANNPNTAGAAFLELQFYPPGLNCSSTQWCVRLHINTLQNKNAFQKANCLEPTTQQYVTTDGTVGGPKLLMSNGDTIVVTIKDTANGLETDVNDVTSSTTGSMVASGANGFLHNSDQLTCATTAFDFHPMYATAAPGQVVPWAKLKPNVSFDFEIGHFELCGDSSCSTLPDGTDEGTCSTSNSKLCKTDSDCPAGETCNVQTNGNCFTIRGVGGCFDSDLDQDGVCYQANWPDGTGTHPSSVIIGAPDDKGVGPLSASTGGGSTYDEGYTTIKFATTEGTATTFYPFFSQAGTGAACRFNFGNDIPGTTTDDFSKAAQYGTTIDNPCFPGIRETKLSYVGQTAQDFNDVATLAARLTDTDSKGLPGLTVSFTLGSQGCSGVTDALGDASCTITITQPPGSYTVTASFAGDSGHRAATVSTPFDVLLEQSALAYTGPVTSDFHDSITASATLTEDGVTPLAGRAVTFTLNGAETCTATTDAGGNASCAITPGEPAGTYPLTASFAGDSLYLPSSTTVSFVVTLEEDVLTSPGGVQLIAQNQPAMFSATLTEDGVTPIAGRTVTITLGSGSGSQSCSGTTDAAGLATCTISPVTVAFGPQPITDSFASDGFYRSATHAQQALIFGFLPSGAFILGDETATSALASGATVTWWGAHWSKDNALSGGSAPPAFEGFAETTSEPPVCGGVWASDPGNSSAPPPASEIPPYMGVLVSSQVAKTGNAIVGNGPSIVVVKTQPGYAPDPGREGTGTVVARFCL